MNTTAELPPTLAQMQYKLSYIQTDDQIRHIEDSLPMDNPRRNELNTLRRQFAGIMNRVDRDLEAQREPGAVLVVPQPASSPKRGGRNRVSLAVFAAIVALFALMVGSGAVGGALVVAAIVP